MIYSQCELFRYKLSNNKKYFRERAIKPCRNNLPNHRIDKVLFIGTSAWKNYDYRDFNSFIFAESYAEGLKYLQDTKKEYLLKESTKDYARLLFSIKNWLDS